MNAGWALETGTLGGYSTNWFAQALPPEDRMVALEFDPHRAEVALRNVANAGVAGQVDLRVGPAPETLAVLLICRIAHCRKLDTMLMIKVLPVVPRRTSCWSGPASRGYRSADR
jgi:hypothetical protein